MSVRVFSSILLISIGLVLLAACGGTTSVGPEKAVETYLNALVNQDVNRLVTVSCKAWEENARMEADSFQAVKARLDGVTCTKTGDEGESAKVSCTGKIVATYGNEDQEIPLDRRPYLVGMEGGEWRMCGYTK